MGVINVTPDSFSDGGCYRALDSALRHADRLAAEGADILDVGGESTRPGAPAVSLSEELDRVVPVVEGIRARLDIPVSIDSRNAEVMRAATAAGASWINDVNALRGPDAIAVARDSGARVCLMHMQGVPASMQHNPRYDDVVESVVQFLSARVDACVAGGIDRARLCIDPGIGFGKRLPHNLALLTAIPRLRALGLPVLIGVSRKSMFGDLLGLPVNQRLSASLSAAAVAVFLGAAIVRAHDVRATVDAVRVAEALRLAGETPAG